MAVRISGNIDTKNPADVYATHLGNLTKGGVHSKDSIAEMNAITLERRTRMMICVVADIGGGSPGLYWLNTPPNPTPSQLIDNNYWEIIPLGTSINGVLQLLGFENGSALTILDSVGTQGDTYIADVAGSGTNPNIFGGVAYTINVGDYLVYESNKWNIVPTGASSVTWATLTGKPTTFPSSPHTHTVADITDFPDLSGHLTDAIVATVITDLTNPLFLATVNAIKIYVGEEIADIIFPPVDLSNYYTKAETISLINAIQGYTLYVSPSLVQLAIDVPSPNENEFAYIQGEYAMYKYLTGVWTLQYTTSLPGSDEAIFINNDVETIPDLKAIGTVSLSLNNYLLFRNINQSNSLNVYKLEAGADIESLPETVRPDDYATGTNEKVWRLASTGGGGGDVTKVGTPLNNQVGVWTGDGTIEGTSGLTYENNIRLIAQGAGANSTVIGANSSSAFANSILIGTYLNASSTASIIIGSAGAGGDGISIGASTQSGVNSVNIGNGIVSFAMNAVAIGRNSSTQGLNGIALGAFSTAESAYTIAIGANTFSDQEGSASFGRNSRTDGIGAIMMGYNTVIQTNALANSFELNWNGNRGFKVGLTYGTGITVNADPDTNLTSAINGVIAYDSTDNHLRLLASSVWQEILTRNIANGIYNPIATGTPDGTKFLRDDNTWQTVVGGGGEFTSDANNNIYLQGVSHALNLSSNAFLATRSPIPTVFTENAFAIGVDNSSILSTSSFVLINSGLLGGENNSFDGTTTDIYNSVIIGGSGHSISGLVNGIIIGGKNSFLQNSTDSVIIGGDGISVNGPVATVFMPKVRLGLGIGGALPTTGETHMLGINSATGEVIQAALPSGGGGIADAPSDGVRYARRDAAWVDVDSAYEASLGNPATDGFVLSSTIVGVRSWVAQVVASAIGPNNAIQTSDGVGGFVNSRVYINEAAGSLTLGDDTLVGPSSRLIEAKGASANLGMRFKTKGAGILSSFSFEDANGTNMLISGRTLVLSPTGGILTDSTKISIFADAANILRIGGGTSEQESLGVFLTDGAVTLIPENLVNGNSDLILANEGTGGIIIGSVGGRISLFGGTAITKQTPTSQTPATFVANTSGISNDTATWNGYTMGDLVAILQAYGLLT